MTTHVVLIQGGGEGAFDEDALLAENLRAQLGDGYAVDYPRMPHEDNPDYDHWRSAIGDAIARAESHPEDHVVVVGHSIGGYLLLKHLADVQLAWESDRPADARSALRIAAVAIIAAPFPGGDADWTFEGFELPHELGALMPEGAAVFLYASEDDEIVPFAHRDLYAAAIPQSNTRTTEGGHQLGNDLALVARDIRSLEKSS